MSTSEQGLAYCKLVADELDAQRSRRAATVERLARVQQSAALPVTLVAAVGSITNLGLSGVPTILLSVGALILVLAVVIASIGISTNTSLLAQPAGLRGVVRGGWQDEEVDARYSVAMHQVFQTEELAKNNGRLHRWSSLAGWVQVAGLLMVGASAVDLLVTK